mmetsp:Transcript_37636/g.103382  ORF Transcript_37636/g.103382 Transcript_37636/m.103382 type:complete len:234 (-) Transcript_37636:414-1115(-)
MSSKTSHVVPSSVDARSRPRPRPPGRSSHRNSTGTPQITNEPPPQFRMSKSWRPKRTRISSSAISVPRVSFRRASSSASATPTVESSVTFSSSLAASVARRGSFRSKLATSCAAGCCGPTSAARGPWMAASGAPATGAAAAAGKTSSMDSGRSALSSPLANRTTQRPVVASQCLQMPSMPFSSGEPLRPRILTAAPGRNCDGCTTSGAPAAGALSTPAGPHVTPLEHWRVVMH